MLNKDTKIQNTNFILTFETREDKLCEFVSYMLFAIGEYNHPLDPEGGGMFSQWPMEIKPCDIDKVMKLFCWEQQEISFDNGFVKLYYSHPNYNFKILIGYNDDIFKTWRINVKPAPEYVACKECTMWEDCENKESRYGCYFGEKKIK